MKTTTNDTRSLSLRRQALRQLSTTDLRQIAGGTTTHGGTATRQQ